LKAYPSMNQLHTQSCCVCFLQEPSLIHMVPEMFWEHRWWTLGQVHSPSRQRSWHLELE
jgi:hypothetical protein